MGCRVSNRHLICRSRLRLEKAVFWLFLVLPLDRSAIVMVAQEDQDVGSAMSMTVDAHGGCGGSLEGWVVCAGRRA